MPSLGELLERDGICTRQQIEDAVCNQVILGGLLGTNLLELGYIDESTLAKYLSRQHNVPCMYGDEIRPDPEALGLLSAADADRLHVIPFIRESRRLQVLCVAPRDFRALDEVAFITGLRPDPIVVPEVRFWQLLQKAYRIERHLRYVALNRADFMSCVMSGESPQAAQPAGPGSAAEELISEEQFARLYHRRDGFPDTQPPPSDPQPAEPLPMLTAEDLEIIEDQAAAPAPPGGIDRRVWQVEGGEQGRRAEDAELASRAAAPPSVPPGPEAVDEQLSFETACERLQEAKDRQAIAAAVLGLASRSFRRAMLFTVHRDTAIGWDARGLDLPPLAVRSLALSLSGPSVFKLVAESRSHYLGGLSRTRTNILFLRLLGKQVPLSVCVLPVLVRGRVVNLFYGDNGHKAHCPNDIGELLILAQRVGRAYEELFQRIRLPG